MKPGTYVIVLAGLLVLQILVIPLFSILDIVPDVVLIGIMYLAMTEGAVPALLAAVFAGLIRDAFSTHFLGANMLALVVSAFLTGVAFKQQEKLNFQAQTVYMFAILFLHHLLYYGIYLLDQQLGFFQLLFRFALPGALYTLAVAAIAHFLLPKGFWR